MAKFHNYYVLCPLIDQKSFLGVSSDIDEDHVIVTLSRNVVNKYRLADQKQVAGWTSKDHITSAVIFDRHLDCYAAVFNNNTIKTWKVQVGNLDKLMKKKFPIHILKIIPKANGSLVIFSNGTCASLSCLLSDSKGYKATKPTINENQTVMDSACCTVGSCDYVCHVLKDQSDAYEVLSCSLREELGDIERSKLNRTKVTRSENEHIVGELIVPEKHGVYFLWSDRKMTFYDFITKMWKSVGSVPWISTVSNLTMVWVGQNHIILFGNNLDQDGAVLVAYNVEIGVGSRRYPMKMYTENAKLYCFDSRIVLEATNHIGIISFILESTRNLASILGSHELPQAEHTLICDWDTCVQPLYQISDVSKDFLETGQSERHICSQVILPLLEKNDYLLVLSTLREFDDVPESVLALALKYAINLLKPLAEHVANIKSLSKLCLDEPNSVEINKYRLKLDLLDSLLKISYSDSLLYPYLRNHLSLDDAVFLLSYIMCLLTYSNETFNDNYEKKLMDWSLTIMDAFYQQMVVTKDEKVTRVLKNARQVVMSLINLSMSMNEVMPAVNKLLSGKPNIEDDDVSSYSIELMYL